MKQFFIHLGMAMVVATGWCSEPPRQLDKANVLPLALDDHFEFRKVKIFLNDPKTFTLTQDPMILFERQRINYGAVDNLDKARGLEITSRSSGVPTGKLTSPCGWNTGRKTWARTSRQRRSLTQGQREI